QAQPGRGHLRPRHRHGPDCTAVYDDRPGGRRQSLRVQLEEISTLRDPIVFFVYGAGDDVVIQTPEQIAGMGLSEEALLEACGGELKRHEVHLVERFCQDNETAIERAISFYSDGGLYRQEETRRAGVNIAQYVKRWTLQDGDGKPLPHSEGRFRQSGAA